MSALNGTRLSKRLRRSGSDAAVRCCSS